MDANPPFILLNRLYYPFSFFPFAALKGAKKVWLFVSHVFVIVVMFLSCICACECVSSVLACASAVGNMHRSSKTRLLTGCVARGTMLSSSTCVTMVIVPSAVCCVCLLHCQMIGQRHTQHVEAGFAKQHPFDGQTSDRAELHTDWLRCTVSLSMWSALKGPSRALCMIGTMGNYN